MNINRANLRQKIRKRRQNLSKIEQEIAAEQLKVNFIQHLKRYNTTKNSQVALYLSNDSELDTSLLIKELWTKNHLVYLPVIHPFNGTTLYFQRYEENSPMRANHYAILEPKLNCSQICPLQDLDYLLMPLVAFDSHGNRLGMGGGFYDKTLARYHNENWQKPQLIGLAHQCQHVESLPVEPWDVPLNFIITPHKIYHW
ncbi:MULTISPECIES: 5-formyltetrahydrofolate cyclo-ligase [unclassified Pseudoalteromonas]|uniref:5-formyltetrahydrofolate cyclo-ligase n=1 Tax=unclassified Pseudoalteromonas TaxID=194690 RepID=UPI000C06F39E|nr:MULTISPECIES: 5-formyltetrahydrofolate cyclo-ligase [unclassified Pseudoalteromonas]MDP2636022.1 5-formyltetrahydrofolate cyclo-ligase [Pseudoalteromonas sp. 1_MG-2023]PHN90657.1 5-formyltetrahydrofolate cyclo-ligase [Pseudoalteromonas sp. 3D05]